MSCPCGSALEYAACCGPRHDGSTPAETAQALMRSRYAAFAKGLGDYLAATQATPSTPQAAAELSRWAASVAWLGLEVRSTDAGGAGDDAGHVEFVARYLEGGAVVALHERSAFTRQDGRWVYVEGKPVVTTTKVERNAPCPCGSGKKFKQCHA